MLRIPPIAPCKVLWKRCVLPLQCNITAAHYALSQVIKTMIQMPRSLLWKHVQSVGLVGCYHHGNGVEAVDLMGYRGGEG